MANTICHVEFYTPDHKATAQFFSDVFGWTTTEAMPNYILWQAGENQLGGGFSNEGVEQNGPGTVVYVHVDDIEATLAKINEHGGKTIMGKTKISDEHGYCALFSDPNGATVGIWCKT